MSQQLNLLKVLRTSSIDEAAWLANMVILINFYDFHHVWYFSVTFPIKRGILLSIVSVLGIEMKYLNNNKKKNNSIVTAAKVFSLATILIGVAGIGAATIG